MKKHIISLAFIFAAFSAWAQSAVSVQVIQNNPGQKKIWATSRYFEQSMLDYFFETGRIASNSPIYIENGDAKKRAISLKNALAENQSGGMDYLVRVELFFREDKTAIAEKAKLSNIDSVSWKIYEVYSGAEVCNGALSTGTVSSADDNLSGVLSFAQNVAENAISKLGR